MRKGGAFPALSAPSRAFPPSRRERAQAVPSQGQRRRIASAEATATPPQKNGPAGPGISLFTTGQYAHLGARACQRCRPAVTAGGTLGAWCQCRRRGNANVLFALLLAKVLSTQCARYLHACAFSRCRSTDLVVSVAPEVGLVQQRQASRPHCEKRSRAQRRRSQCARRVVRIVVSPLQWNVRSPTLPSNANYGENAFTYNVNIQRAST